MRAFRVRGAGVELAVTERGLPDGPTVVLVHGYPDTSAVWGPVAAELAARHRVVTYDVRGAGGSDAPARTADYALDLLVADQLAVLDAVSPDRPVHLVGHDWGSLQGWATLADERSAGRVASYTSISGPSLDHVAAWVRRRLGLRPAGLREVLGQGFRSWYVYAFHLPGAPLVWRRLAGRWGRMIEAAEGARPDADWPAPTLAEDAARGVNLYRANMRHRLRSPRTAVSDVPVQVVVPTRDPFISPALLDGIEALAPDLVRRDVPAGHWVVRSRPAAVARWVAEHVAAVEAGTRPSPHADDAPAVPVGPVARARAGALDRRGDATAGSAPPEAPRPGHADGLDDPA